MMGEERIGEVTRDYPYLKKLFEKGKSDCHLKRKFTGVEQPHGSEPSGQSH